MKDLSLVLFIRWHYHLVCIVIKILILASKTNVLLIFVSKSKLVLIFSFLQKFDSHQVKKNIFSICPKDISKILGIKVKWFSTKSLYFTKLKDKRKKYFWTWGIFKQYNLFVYQTTQRGKCVLKKTVHNYWHS